MIDYLKALPEDRSRGMQILLDDGKILAEITNVEDDFIECVVKQGGRLSSRKSINLPDFNIPMPYISSADREDIEFGLKQGVDYIAASFVRSPDDVIKLRDFVDSLGYEDVEIISKIENQQGVDHIDQIIDVSDGIMVARGDMGVEIPFIQLPAIQKSIIRKCVSKGKYVITATQMLESMTASPRPTRAEISDVANAVFDGTSSYAFRRICGGKISCGKRAGNCFDLRGSGGKSGISRSAGICHRFGFQSRLHQGNLVSGGQNRGGERGRFRHHCGKHDGAFRKNYDALPPQYPHYCGGNRREGLQEAVPELGNSRDFRGRKRTGKRSDQTGH